MVSENDPTINIFIDAEDRFSDCRQFKIVNAGLLKVPTATIWLKNTDGEYTTGANEILPYDTVEIKADVRGTVDLIFYGRIYRPVCKIFKPKVSPYLELRCKAFGQKTVRETKTFDYADKGWRCKEAIEDFLAHPDSGSDTGCVLETDSGDIVNKEFPINMDGEYLLDGIRAVAEELNYDGYWKGTDWSTPYFKAVGTDQVSPTIHLQHPFVFAQPDFDIEEIKNYILIRGATDQGHPIIDIWCENGVARYSPVAWTGEDASTEVTDDNGIKMDVAGNNYSIRIKRVNTIGVPAGVLDIANTGYVRPSNKEKNTINLNTNRFRCIALSFKFNDFTDSIAIWLYDSTNKKAVWSSSPTLYGFMSWYSIEVSVLVADHNKWNEDSGFDWTNIKKVRIATGGSQPIGSFFNADLLCFRANGWAIDSLLYPTYAPPVKDDTSIGLYGRTVYRLEDQNIKSFEQVMGVGETFLSVNKNIFKRIKVKKGAKTWAMPSQYLQLSIPEYGISSEDWRILVTQFDWHTNTKLLRSTMTLVPKLYGLPTSTARMDEIGGLLGEIMPK